jgi:hypothetical protein
MVAGSGTEVKVRLSKGKRPAFELKLITASPTRGLEKVIWPSVKETRRAVSVGNIPIEVNVGLKSSTENPGLRKSKVLSANPNPRPLMG